jgi:AcrR family transcriptional regulator
MGAARLKTAAELFGVVPPARNARDRLINTAIDLFYSEGFNAVGLDRVLDKVGVTKTTFYKHFESKDDLVLAAIRQRDEWEAAAWNRAVQQIAGDDPKATLLAFFEVLDVWFNDPSFGGCIFINAAAEFPNPNDPVHQAAAEHKVRTRHQFRDLALQAGATDAERFADLFAMLVEGTLIMRHVHHRNDAARVARSEAERLVREFIPSRPRQRTAAKRPKPILRLPAQA